jgi:hypothetical protein
MSPQELFKSVVDAVGLSMIIGPGVVKRALPCDPLMASPQQYAECLGRMEARLASYLGPEGAAARMVKIRAIIQLAEQEQLRH